MNTPSHLDIALHARHLWHDRGCPAGCDTAIWLEAERHLNASNFAESQATADTLAARAQNVTATAAAHEQESIQAVLQKKNARAPQAPRHTGPKNKPGVTGKPVWSQPHSS